MARAALNWTLRDLENKSGVNRNTISRYEAGKEILSGSLRALERVFVEGGVNFVEEDGKFGVLVQAPIDEELSTNSIKRKETPTLNLKKRSQRTP
jgi:transcriptional regulator with XRE-family HTH domain